MVDHIGRALAAWLVPVNAWTAALLVGGLLVDRLVGHRLRASLRIALYAPIALRVVLPLSWSIPVARLPSAALVLPLQALAASPAPASRLLSWHAGLALAYVAVAVALAVRGIARRRRLWRALECAAPYDATRAPYPVLRHRELGPMVVGIVQPRIVLPEAMLEQSTEHALACVLKHEIAHVRRGDPWLSAAMEILLVVAWPVAPLWVAASRVRHLIELACDEAALAGADAAERRRYGHVLLDVAEERSFVAALHFGATLRARIEAIALQRPWPRSVQGSVVIAAVAGFAACSSAGPGAVPQATDSARPAARAGGVDQYGYEFDKDPLANGAVPRSKAPTQTTNAEGRLAPEAIQNVVRQGFGAFRQCYENALKANGQLQGTVAVSFTIAADGSVQSAADHGSTLPDADVVQCVVGGFSRLAFPPPQGGQVTVVYPVVFRPGP
jgi:Zn-dependent protease with chaperone function